VTIKHEASTSKTDDVKIHCLNRAILLLGMVMMVQYVNIVEGWSATKNRRYAKPKVCSIVIYSAISHESARNWDTFSTVRRPRLRA